MLQWIAPGLVRTCESHFLVTEKGVRKDIVIQPCHIDGNEIPLAIAQIMNSPCDQLLAYARFTRDQHRLRSIRDCLNILKDRLHGFAIGYDLQNGLRMFQLAEEHMSL
jgi:hypothetical protein